mgnify:CR=1 FL=1
MIILHTSDWHLGRSLHGKKRYAEFEAFLSWLMTSIQQQRVDVLLVAGDVFDSSVPSNRAQELYYSFLCRVAASPCRHVVVIAGNHDSPSLLEAPRELLKVLDVHVVGSISEKLDDEVLVLADKEGAPELIVCAVPYLRDRDIRQSEAGESMADKEEKLLAGIRNHYAQVFQHAEEQRQQLGGNLPIIAMGHLFAAGGSIGEGEGMRELYIGSLARVDGGIFPASVAYVALGHLHIPQKIRGSELIRYSGSPLAMGFGEAGQQKSVCLLHWQPGAATTVQLLPVPVLQRLERIRGDWPAITARLEVLAAAQESIWLEVVYEGEELLAGLRERIDQAVTGTKLEVLRVQNNRVMQQALAQAHLEESLDDLSVDEVFARRLDGQKVPEEQRPALLSAYRQVVQSLTEEDSQAE